MVKFICPHKFIILPPMENEEELRRLIGILKEYVVRSCKCPPRSVRRMVRKAGGTTSKCDHDYEALLTEIIIADGRYRSIMNGMLSKLDYIASRRIAKNAIEMERERKLRRMGSRMVAVSVKMPSWLLKALDEASRKLGVPRSSLVRLAIEYALNSDGWVNSIIPSSSSPDRIISFKIEANKLIALKKLVNRMRRNGKKMTMSDVIRASVYVIVKKILGDEEVAKLRAP